MADGEARETIKTLRLNAQEVAAIERRMEASGYRSFSDYARHVLIHGEMRVTTYAFDARTIRTDLARIGNNLNQIARAVNVEDSLTLEQATQARRLMRQVQQMLTDAMSRAVGTS